MRALFWILLLLNAILFAVILRGGWSWGEQAYQVQPALHEEKIRLLDTPQNVPGKTSPATEIAVAQLVQEWPTVLRLDMKMTNPAPADIPVQAAKSAPVVKPVQVAKPAPAAKPVQIAKPAPAVESMPAVETASVVEAVPAAVKQGTMVCLEWGDFSGADLARATKLLSALKLGAKLSQRQVEYNKGYWVFIPPLRDKAAVDKKISQLKARGVKEFFVVQDAGAWRYAISLGIFKTQEAAQNYHKELRAKDVRTAQVGERASKLKTTMFMLNGVGAQTEAKLTAAKKGFSGSELKNVPCTLTR